MAVIGGAYSLAVSVVFTLVVTRRLPTPELALLSIFNTGLAVALSILNYVTAWYPRILAREPWRFEELAGAGTVAALAAWAALAAYLAIYGVLDLPVLAAGLALLILNAWPAGAYLSIHRQRLAAALGYVGQTVKLGGAFVVRQFPTVEAALLVNVAMSLPSLFAKRAGIRLSAALRAFRGVAAGAPYQTLYVAAAAAWSALTYAAFLAGGDRLLSYHYILFQISKAVYPALTIVPLMYGSLLVESDKLRRALLDGAALLYLYLIPAAVMAKSPDWFLALLRPAELGNTELVEAVRLNGIALLLSGIFLHVDTTLRGAEDRSIFTLRDRPAKALMLDVVNSAAAALIVYVLAKAAGAPGMVIGFAISLAAAAGYRLWLLGYTKLLTELYLPAALALGLVYALPLPLMPYSTGNLLETVATYIPNAAILTLATSAPLLLSPPTRQAAALLLKKYLHAGG